METAALLAALLFTLLPPSPAQDVRAVDHYISDTAPVAGIGVGEVVPARANEPMRTGMSNSRMPDVSSRNSPPPDTQYISRETEHTISYVEDVLAGRTDASKGVRDSVFESDSRVAEKPMTSTGYSRVNAPDGAISSHGGIREDDSRGVAAAYDRGGHRDSLANQRRPDEDTRAVASSGSPREPPRSSGAGGYSRDETRPATPSRVVPKDSGGLQRRPEEGVRTGVGTGGLREVSGNVPAVELPRGDRRDAVPSRPRDDRPGTGAQYDGGSSNRATLSGSGDRGGSAPSRDVPDRNPAAAGNTRGYSREDEPVNTRKEPVWGSDSSLQESYSGSGRKDIRDPVNVNSRDAAAVNPSRDSTVGRDRVPVIDRPRENAFDDSRDESFENSRGDAYGNTRDESVEYSRDRVVGHSRDSVYDDSRGTEGGHSHGSAPGHSRETTIDHSRDRVVDHSRDTIVKHSYDTDNSRETSVENSRDYIDVKYKATTPAYHRDPATSLDTYGINNEKSERDSGLAQPQEYPLGGSVEEPIYTSRDSEILESGFSFDKDEEEDGEDIDVSHSTRPMMRTQKPRQVSAVPDRRGARGPHPASPCPSVFSYEGTRAGKERWYGVVLVSTSETLTGIRLEIRLDKRADLLGTWLGEVSSVDNIRYTIWNGRRRVEPGPPLSVKIFVKYSDQEYEPPRVRTIRLNGRQICPMEKGAPVVVPKPPVKPPNRPTQAANRPTQAANRPTQATNRPTQPRPAQRPSRPGSAAVQKPSRPQGNTRPPQKPVHPGQSTAATELVDGVACGRIEVQPSPLITYGQRTARGQWPWHAAIYQSKGTDLSYICGGSLIGKRTILTAAHCVSRRYIDRPVDPETLVVYLGKYHLKLWSEGGVQDKQVLEVHVHPEYNSTDFRADIAILVLSSAVEFTVYVKPVCLWDRNRPQLNEIEGHEGVVVGWGYDESGMVTEDLMMAKMPVVSQQTCIWSYPQFFSHFTSNRTYCAGFRNGTSVCNGDSGGGMVFPKTIGIGTQGKTVTWALRGIVSLSTSQANKRVCNTDHYVVFTDVVKFYDWMNKYH